MKNVTLTILQSLLTLSLLSQQSDSQEEPMELEKESESSERAINHWDKLPSELKLCILSYLKVDDLRHLLYTSHDLKDHALDPLALKSFLYDLFYRSNWMQRNYYNIYKAFFGLIKQGNKKLVELFLKVSPGLANETHGHFLSTPLITATVKGQREIVEVLLDNGANVNKCSPRSGYTPLRIAVAIGYKLIAQLLITRGAEVNETEAKLNPLYIAIAGNDASMVKLLLANNANPNITLSTNGTPLAVLTGIKSPYLILKLLIEAGASISKFLQEEILRNAKQNDDLETEELIQSYSNDFDQLKN